MRAIQFAKETCFCNRISDTTVATSDVRHYSKKYGEIQTYTTSLVYLTMKCHELTTFERACPTCYLTCTNMAQYKNAKSVFAVCM